jgi:chromosome partitioning protein
MIVTIGGTKGGVGKTTTALQLALARTLTGSSILLVDGDRQGSALTAVSMRSEAARSPGLACVHYPDERVLRAQVQQQAPRYDDVIIDVGGRDSAALRAALLLSDILIVPVQPRSLDVWAFSDIAALVDGAQEARAERGRPPLRACAVLSMADTGASSDNTAAVEALAEHGQFTWIDAPIRRRKAFANATGLGLAVTEMTPRDAKACEEIAELVRNVFTIAGKLHTNAKGTV